MFVDIYPTQPRLLSIAERAVCPLRRGGAAAAGGAQPPQASDLEVRDITDLVSK